MKDIRTSHHSKLTKQDFLLNKYDKAMTISEFRKNIAEGRPLEGEEMIECMCQQGEEARKTQFELNSKYHTPEEICQLFSEITS